MKLALALVLTLLASAAAFSQSTIRDGLKVNGLALGSTYAATVRKLGKPTRDVTRKADECTGSRTRTLTYPGLKVELIEGDRRNDFTVFSFDVTSAKWDVSGVKIGDTPATIERLFGKTGRTIEKERTGPRWFYEMTDEAPGGTNFYFRNGKVVEISSTYEMC
jgi:hypothetical protein